MNISDFIYFASKDLTKDIGTINQDSVKPFWSDGKWSMHDLLLYIITLIGPSKVYISTFSISEIAIRAFSLAMEEKQITELHCFFDYTIKKNKLNLLHFAGEVVTDIKLGANHSKVILLENDDWFVTVVGSANMTPNPRKEAGAIFSDQSTFMHFKECIIHNLENGQPCFID